MFDRESIIKNVEKSIVEFIKEYCKNPFEYFYEEDIRASLLTYFKSKINFSSDYPTLNYSDPIKNSSIKSSIIKSEYPSHKRFDIAFLGYQEDKDFYNQPVFMAIEIKLGSHMIGSDQTSGFKSDIIKLKECLSSYNDENFIGIAIYFCQTPISIDDIKKWYIEIPFEQLYINQIILSTNNVYAIIVPGEQSEKIFLSKIKS